MKYIIPFIILLFGFTLHSQTVYKTPYGKKYHKATCRMVENVSSGITIADARDMGLTACKICKPPVLANSTMTLGTNTPRGVSQSVQCKGTTKTGTRCRHRTSIANGYCFQHNPDK